MNKRLKFGRRKSDWILPVTLFLIALAAGLWGQRSYVEKREAEEQRQDLTTQVQLYERLLKQKEKAGMNPNGEPTKSATPR